ncbi:MAG: sugar phosphate isomerase/epimerase [Bacteroidetes bacterium]|nr:sugar phosphate isomerase/epimerase [Bacteroidota bacterium]
MNILASVTPNKTSFGPLLFSGDLETGGPFLGNLGYNGLEVSLRTPQDMDVSNLYAMLDDNGMELLSIATGQSYVDDGLYVFSMDEEVRDEILRRFFSFIDIAAPYEGMVILGGIKGRLDKEDPETQFRIGEETIDRCLEYAEKKKVTLLLEAINRYETNLFNTVGSCAEFTAKRNSPYLKALADTFHMNLEEVSIEGSLDAAAPHIGVIHCADSNRLAPGMGHLDFKSILKNIKNYSSLRYLGVEVLPLPDSSICAETAMNTLKSFQ